MNRIEALEVAHRTIRMRLYHLAWEDDQSTDTDRLVAEENILMLRSAACAIRDMIQELEAGDE